MVEDWISRANAKQRRGRAGRVKPGICFCLYTRYRFEKIMRSFQVLYHHTTKGFGPFGMRLKPDLSAISNALSL